MQCTPVFSPGRGAWWATGHGVAGSDMTEVTDHACISLKAFFSRLKAVASTQGNLESEICWALCVCVCVCVWSRVRGGGVGAVRSRGGGLAIKPGALFHKVESVSPSAVSDYATPQTIARQSPLSMEFSRQENSLGSRFLLQGISQTQGLNPGLLHCRQILYH